MLRLGLWLPGEPRLEARIRRLADDALVIGALEVGGRLERHVCEHEVVFERASALTAHFAAFVESLGWSGTAVMNEPRWAAPLDRLSGLALASRLGVPTARAALLPLKAYPDHVDHGRDLAQLRYPVRFEALLDYVGVPGLLRPLDGRRPGQARPVTDHASLMAGFDASGAAATILQHHGAARDGRPWPVVRVLCVGETPVAERGWDVWHERYEERWPEGWTDARADAGAMCARLAARHRLDLWAADFRLDEDGATVIGAAERRPALEEGGLDDEALDAVAAAVVARARHLGTDPARRRATGRQA